MKRRWFRAEDGTYCRNCPLILAEIKKAEVSLWFGRRRRLDALQTERDQAWREGVIRKATLDRGDVVIEPLPMRIAYPQHPILWTLDERRPR